MSSAQSVNTKDMKIFLQQMEKSICNIKLENCCGTGFFCLIQINDYESMQALITCNHVLNEKQLFSGEKIVISINNNNKNYEFLIDKSRKIYSNREFNITIIEITKRDGLNDISFLGIDNQIFNSNINELYRKQQIYLLYYDRGLNSKYSTGIISNFQDYRIMHNSSSGPGSSGGPLINLNNYKVIGIHIGANKRLNLNYGLLLQRPIEEFKKKYNNNKPDSLKIKLKETREELNKEILKNQKLEEKIKELENELAK